MFEVESVALIGFAYICILFCIAYFGDSDYVNAGVNYNSNLVYALSLAVYCSSWTFYGAVGTAVTNGLDYLAIYLGPCLVFLFGYPVMRRIIMICKQNSITSISDFISSRYGKDRKIGILVTVIAVVGSLPYIALQLKAVSSSYLVLISKSVGSTLTVNSFASNNIVLFTGAALALFTILFGTRHLDTTEHHKGMVLAIAFESIVKLLAILAVGYYAIYLLFNNEAHEGFSQSMSHSTIENTFSKGSSSVWSFATKLLLAISAIILLPRQFQVTVVEARDHRQFKTAMWVMPIYLILTSIIVIPIALTGSVLMPNSDADLYVLTLPLTAQNNTLALVAFIGGLSAATGMVIVAAISLSTMVCNDLVMPYLISHKRFNVIKRDNLNDIILIIRRVVIVGLILGAYGYFVLIDINAQLANIGLISFAAIVQFVPAVACALYWQKANKKGVFWGLITGFVFWVYTLLLPTIFSENLIIAIYGESSWLHPQSLFGFSLDNPLTHGVFWSLLVNIGVMLWFSFRQDQSVIEKIQASRFFFIGNAQLDSDNESTPKPYTIPPNALKILAERIIGVRNTTALFEQYEKREKVSLGDSDQVDRTLLSLVQTAIAGVIGSTSAQKVIADTFLRDDECLLEEATTFVDETSSVLTFNRNLLHTALQNITHGISVVDSNLNLVVWNDNYLKLFNYPENLVYVGKPIIEVLRFNADRGDFVGRDNEAEINKRIKYLQRASSYSLVRKRPDGTTIKSIGEPMPGGGFVTTYENITKSVKASELLSLANEELESRVKARTNELEALTLELENNTRSKTHFLAAASHDLLQPINAARLFAHSIVESNDDPKIVKELASNIDQSLVTANELLRALLDVSKLDSGGIQPEPINFKLRDFIEAIIGEMKPTAQEKNIHLQYMAPDVVIYSDKQLLLSLMQNLIANALRYTSAGGEVFINAVLDTDKNSVLITVRDNGIGIPEEYLDKIFNEFYQIKKGNKKETSGLGLGLSIVKRISHLLNMDIAVKSEVGKGTTFSLSVPFSETVSQTQAAEQQSSIFTVTTDSLKNAKILCLDNDEDVLNAMQTLMLSWGCSVTCELTYKKAKQALSNNDFDIVLADYRLDYDETGIDFLSLIDCHGVLITAEQDKTLQSKAEDMGFQFLAKPIEPAALKALLLFFLNTSS